MCTLFFFFFFSSRRRHTRLQGDWSSDVCSSDLDGSVPDLRRHLDAPGNVPRPRARARLQDRKNTRLNSSHLVISYAVFCLKKKCSHSVPRKTRPAVREDLCHCHITRPCEDPHHH